MNEQAARILERTADLLEKNGWCRNTWSVYGRRCLVGGLNAATRTELGLGSYARGSRWQIARDEAAEHLCWVIWGQHFTGIGDLTGWNDGTAKNKQEVLDVCRKAAKHALGVS